MKTSAPESKLASRSRVKFDTAAARWQAIVKRNPTADDAFFYSVKTTGIFCRPSCASRLPRRENVSFHESAMAAELAGFRACKRCAPTGPSLEILRTEAVTRACAAIAQAEEPLATAQLARAAGMSLAHFTRVFREVTGITPQSYARAQRLERTRAALQKSGSVTEAMYEAGYRSSGRFYAEAPAALGMAPARLLRGGSGETIRFALGQSSLGAVLVATTDKGVCAILLGDDGSDLPHDLARRFPRAHIEKADATFRETVASVIAFIEAPRLGLALPLDIRGTLFQQKVWRALQQIPPGERASYTEVAQRLGVPAAVRAVAGACAANALAVAIPCHRVVRSDGGLSGYRWGTERKRALLEREAAAQPAA